MKHRFSEKFERQFIAALNGAAPWRSQMEKPYVPIPPTEKQTALILKLGAKVPKSKNEASDLISRLLGR